MVNYFGKGLAALATVYLACTSPTTIPTVSVGPSPLPVLKNDDCGVEKIHTQLYETIMNYDGQQGLSVKSPGRVELRFRPLYPYVIGHDLEKGLYSFQDESTRTYIPLTGPNYTEEGSPRFYFSEGYVPRGDEMACDLAERLLDVSGEN